MRGVVEDDVLDGYLLPAGAGIYLNFYTLHRHPDFWPDPERFDPERFSPQQAAGRHRAAYQPFATGPRNCIGKHFARTELHVIATMVLQSYNVRLAPGPRIRPKPLITLCPDPGVRLLLEPR
jgi:cytochrome P450